MAFDSLSEKLQNIFKNLRGKGRLSEADVKAALKEVKMALLEADVNFKVVKQFVNTVTERAIGQDVMKSLTPGQMVIKIVNEEMVTLMGSERHRMAHLFRCFRDDYHLRADWQMSGRKGEGQYGEQHPTADGHAAEDRPTGDSREDGRHQ